jgi:hypothetical protein|eukprot:Stramenopile-MAST_4_protein_32
MASIASTSRGAKHVSVRRAKKRAATEKSANATPIKEIENVTLLDGETGQDTEHERLSKLFQAAAAAYSGTTLTGEGAFEGAQTNLIQGQVDHTVQLGSRVFATPEDMKEMIEQFDLTAKGQVCQLDKCVVCARTVTHGDLGIDHILYYFEGDENRRTARVRSIPRIWCEPCARKRAKIMKKPYVKSKEQKSWKDAWMNFANEIKAPETENKEESASKAAPVDARPPAINAHTSKVWKWIESKIAGKDDPVTFSSGKNTFRVTKCKARGYVDDSIESYRLKMLISFEARTTLRSGMEVLSRGKTTLEKSWNGNEEMGEITSLVNLGACVLVDDGNSMDPELSEMCLQKCDLMTKIYNKKVVPLIFARVANLKDQLTEIANA